jgi:hypothetical protein
VAIDQWHDVDMSDGHDAMMAMAMAIEMLMALWQYLQVLI